MKSLPLIDCVEKFKRSRQMKKNSKTTIVENGFERQANVSQKQTCTLEDDLIYSILDEYIREEIQIKKGLVSQYKMYKTNKKKAQYVNKQ